MFKGFYYDLLQSIGIGIYYINREGEIEFWNKEASNITGFELRDVKGKKFNEVLYYVDEMDNPLDLEHYPASICLKRLEPLSKTLYIKDKNKQKKFVEETPSPVFKNNKLKGVISILRDIESLSESSTQKRLIPICAWCKKIKVSNDLWQQIETYLTESGFGVFTHGMCPDCAQKIFEKKVYLESYQNICKAISSSLSLSEVLNLIVTNAVKVMNVKASMLRLLNKETQKLEVAAYYGLSEKYVNKGPVDYDKSIEDALTGKAVSIYDITFDKNARYLKEAEDEGIRSILSIPVKFKKEVIGVLRMYTAEPVKYTDEDLKFMTAIAEQAAIAIINARTYETSLSRAKEYLRVFEEVTKAVSSTLRLNEVLNLIVKKLPEVMNLKAATIRLLDESGQKLELVAAYGLSERYLERGPVDLEENVKEALQSKPVAIYDVATDQRVHYQKEAMEEGIKSMLTLPIIARGKVIGVLRLLTDEYRHFSDEDVAFSASLGEVCGTAIENARMYEQLRNK
jgi:PAS domain S-box-containing protein